MIGLLQRVTEARVDTGNECLGAINTGLLVLIGVEKNDTEAEADRLVERLLTYRVFPDADGKMNLSLSDIHGGLLLVPQFTLAADTGKGTRPGFSTAAPPETGEKLFDHLLARARTADHAVQVEAGRFGADMQVTLTNNGPVTFWLRVPPRT
ncbi:MAG: D-aminoacyl-tRNA deacylase [Gammaproteobacteria bacterium]|nr:D-aminoacyl-tRNA deacylase [Gammaproteobacteria bacterium]